MTVISELYYNDNLVLIKPHRATPNVRPSNK